MSASIAVQVAFLVVVAVIGTAMLVLLMRCHRALREIRELRPLVEELLRSPERAGGKKCPGCAEVIRAEARVCPHCRYHYETQYRVVVKSRDTDLAHKLATEVCELTLRPEEEIMHEINSGGVGFTFKHEDMAKVSARAYQDQGFTAEIEEVLV